jgi:hypothetical protein
VQPQIPTPVLVLATCGVLKDVLLVAASMMLWYTPVSKLQFLAYAISLAGLMYYRLGLDQLGTILVSVRNDWTAFSAKHRILKTVIAIISSWLRFPWPLAFCYPSLRPIMIRRASCSLVLLLSGWLHKPKSVMVTMLHNGLFPEFWRSTQ